jgi:hypothetical protein
VDVVGREGDDVAGAENGAARLDDLGVAGAAPIVDAPPCDVRLAAGDADLHGPDAVIVRRQAAARQQGCDDHREAMIRLLVQRMDGETLRLVALEEARLQPSLGEGQPARRRPQQADDFTAVICPRRDAAHVADEIGGRVFCRHILNHGRRRW